MLGLKHFRSRAKGVPDLLNYASLVGPGVIRNKDGSLLAGFFYRGEDGQSSTAERRNIISARVNAALARLGTGWVTWVDSVRLPTAAYSAPEASHFPDHVSQMIDAERRAHFTREGEHFETENAIYLMYLPPLQRSSKFADLLYASEDAKEEAAADRHHKTFERQLEELADGLSDVVKLRRMEGFTYTDAHGRTHLRDELVNCLHAALTGDDNPINVPPVPMYLDAYLGGQELWTGKTPRIGDKHIAAIAIEGFPPESFPGLLDVLDHLAIPYRFSSRMIYLDQQEALQTLKKKRRGWKQGERGFASQVFRTQGGVINEDAMMMAREVEAAMNDANSSLVIFGYYTPVVILMEEDPARLKENARIVAREIRREGFATRVEEENTLEAWLGSLPGHTVQNVRRPVMHTLSLADMLPLSNVWAGQAHNPCPFYPEGSPALLQGATTGATPFWLNLHVGDVGHTLVFGPTGAGKSVFLATIASQFLRYKGATITAFDKGNSMLPLCLATGGQHYDLGGEASSPGLCPLQHIDSDADAAWAVEWLETCFQLQANRPVTPEERGEIHRAIVLMRRSVEGRSFSDFLTTVQSAAVREALEHYSITGPLGPLLDSRTDELAESHFTVCEIEELMGMGDRNAIPVLLYLFRRFERRLKGQPALLILDEAWLMLGHPVFREKIREWLKVLRKANCAVILATQSLADVARSGILDTLAENCPTKIFLPNEEAIKSGTENTLGPRDLYTVLGCNEKQIEIIAAAKKKHHYYLTSPEGHRLFTLELGPVARAFVAVSDKEQVARVRALAASYGPAWPMAWLQERNVNVSPYLNEVVRHAA